MATNLALDDQLIEEARLLGGHRTKREVVTQALLDYVEKKKQLQILNSFGTIDFDPTYDAKAQRQFKRGDSVGLNKAESKSKRAS
jgi:hypothetical protein